MVAVTLTLPSGGALNLPKALGTNAEQGGGAVDAAGYLIAVPDAAAAAAGSAAQHPATGQDEDQEGYMVPMALEKEASAKEMDAACAMAATLGITLMFDFLLSLHLVVASVLLVGGGVHWTR